MRDRGVWHRGMQARSITELEMYDKWPGLCTGGDIELLRNEGYVDADGNITEKGTKKLESFKDKEKKK